MYSLPRCDISITDMPLPCQSSISSRACARTSCGNTAGPALKLKIRPMKTVLSLLDLRKIKREIVTENEISACLNRDVVTFANDAIFRIDVDQSGLVSGDF